MNRKLQATTYALTERSVPSVCVMGSRIKSISTATRTMPLSSKGDGLGLKWTSGETPPARNTHTHTYAYLYVWYGMVWYGRKNRNFDVCPIEWKLSLMGDLYLGV